MMVAKALEALQRNRVSLLFYVTLTTLVQTARNLADVLLIKPASETIAPLYLTVYGFSADLFVAVGLAAVQAVGFARIGREMDRPLWKVEGDREAFKRFFQLWLVLDLIALSSLRMIERLVAGLDDPAAAFSLLIVWVMATSAFVVFGAAVMFYGRVAREEIGAAVNTLIDEFPRTAAVWFLACAFSIFVLLPGQVPLWAFPLLALIDGAVTCLIFSASWLICMYHRDEDDRDTDFDL